MNTSLMPTKKKRINITVSDKNAAILEILAKEDGVPVATKARQLVEVGMELLEDIALSAIAEERDTDDAEYISHEEA